MPVVPKKWKVKIGTKAEAGEVKDEKRFMNGHKSFTSAEARALNEQQQREKVTLDLFDSKWRHNIRPRNPLCGEETPRDGNKLGTHKVDGFLLFPEYEAKPQTPPQHTMWSKRNRPKKAALKVGQLEDEEVEKYKEMVPLAPKTSPTMERELKRINAMRVIQHSVMGELEFLKSKLGDRQSKISSNLLLNMKATLNERDLTKETLQGLRT